MTALLLALILATSPVDAAVTAAGGGSCTGYTSRTVPPTTLKVFRLHRRGSSIPARVETWTFTNYVGRVMRSGAWPGRPRASAIVGAIAIKQWAWWMVLHHQPGYSWRGRCYSVTDSDQYLEPSARPGDSIPRRTRDAVHDSWPVSLRKSGRLFRTGWTGGAGRDGWRLHEDSITARARRGWSWRHLLHWALDPNLTIRGNVR